MRCPAPIHLIEYALGAAPAREGRLARHVDACASCRVRVRALRETVSALRSDVWRDGAPPAACLTEHEIGLVAEGLRGQEHGDLLVHLAACDGCRDRLAALTRLLHDDAVAAELEPLDGGFRNATRPRLRTRYFAAAATLAAAVWAGVQFRPPPAVAPPPLDGTAAAHGESAITTTSAPRLLGPVGPAGTADPLIWSSVPHADRYRVRVFDRSGTLAFDAQTNDTTLQWPAYLRGRWKNAYRWKVEARTGWHRWVASEWRDLVIRREADTR